MNNKKRILSGVILSLLVITLIIISSQRHTKQGLSTINPENTVIETNTVIDDGTIYGFQIADTYIDDEQLGGLLSQAESINDLKKFNKDINGIYNFLEITMQPLEIIGQYYEGSSEFVLIPRSKKDLRNQKVLLDGKETFVTPLKAIQIGDYAFSTYFNHIQNGRGFNDKDFKYKKGNDIPIIVGDSYKDYYKLGDSIKINYLERDVSLMIIGFFQKNLSISINGNLYNLDEFICSPHFDIEDINDDEDRIFQQRYYLQKNNGYIQLDENTIGKLINETNSNEINLEDYSKKIDEISKKNHLSYIPLELITEIEVNNYTENIK